MSRLPAQLLVLRRGVGSAALDNLKTAAGRPDLRGPNINRPFAELTAGAIAAA